MLHNKNLFILIGLAVLTLIFASPASASSCTAQGTASYETCMQNMGADGVISAWEEGVCGRWAADIVSVCEQQTKPNMPSYELCERDWKFVIIWYSPSVWELVLLIQGPLVCS